MYTTCIYYLFINFTIPKRSKRIHLQIPTMMTLKEITIKGFAKQLK